ncbi:MAG: hemerythrin domain-containing protein [Methanobacteriaceae archaeon]
MVKNLYEFLKKEHRDVEELFRITLDQKVLSYFPKIKNELCIHMNSEEQYLYPPLEKVDKVTVYEGYEEHQIAKRLIKDLHPSSAYDEKWLAKAKVLREIIEHHIKEAENMIFAIAEKTLKREQEEEILSKFKEEKSKDIKSN